MSKLKFAWVVRHTKEDRNLGTFMCQVLRYICIYLVAKSLISAFSVLFMNIFYVLWANIQLLV